MKELLLSDDIAEQLGGHGNDDSTGNGRHQLAIFNSRIRRKKKRKKDEIRS